MRREKGHKLGLKGFLFGFLAVFLAIFSVMGVAPQAYAEENTEVEPNLIAVEPADREKEDKEKEEKEKEEKEKELLTADNCQDSLGSIGWLVCPTTGKIAEAVDFLYGVLQDFLEVNPVEVKDGQPVYEIWKYCRAVTNIVFIIFFLVVIYSQLTGVGISNYGIKKALPKLVVVAILMNLSFLICSLAVDVSNIMGNGLRGIFDSIQTEAAAGMEVTYSSEDLFAALAAGSTVTIGGTAIAFATGAIWMIIPVLLGSLVSVVAGLITIAMRQAVVILLIMVAPLAIVAYMLPNTENLFKKWKKLMTQMLVFYPAFSVLFGASQLAGFAIITSADNWFSLLLGVAVQIFPLFFAVKMMQMSGTFLGSVSNAVRGFAAKPLATNRAWADSHRELTRRKNAAMESKMPSRRLVGFLADRRTQREAAAGRLGELQKSRAMAKYARRNYRANGVPTRKGEKEYENIARTLEYQREVERDANNMNAGLGMLAAVNKAGNVSKKQKARIDALDNRIVNASDYLNVEKARGERVQYENAVGFHKRMNAALEAHMDIEHGYTVDPDTGMRVRDKEYKMHMQPGSAEAATAATRYAKMNEIMEGNAANVQYAAATAARGFDAQKKIVENTYQKYFDLTPPTKDVVYRLTELTKQPNAAEYMDAIIPGLRVLSQRGDTDLVRKQMNNVLNGSGGLKLGTNASQSLASFLMLEVGDKDPWMRRFGKYINLETARVYNKNDRQELKVNYDEYIKGYHDEPDPTPEEPLRVRRLYARKGMKELMQGTPVDNVERTALANFDASLREAYTGPNGLEIDEYFEKRNQVQKAIGPQFASASLKYLSGSEQLNSFVKFLTGYSQNQVKKNDQVVIDEKTKEPIYVWQAAWEKGGEFSDNAEHAKKAKEYFRRKTLEYITAQTPTQIYSLRSDYKTPLFEHLADAYELDEMEGWSDEERENHRKYMDGLAEIDTRYGDLPLEEAAAKRAADKKALRKQMESEIAGAEFRHILDKVGTLNMLYRTRDKGAANGAKPWVRDWLDLENEQMIRAKLKKDGKRGKKAKNAGGDADGDKIYGDAERTEFVARVSDMYENLGTEREDKFYDESLQYVQDNLGKGSYIVKEYEKYAKRETSADSEMLKDYLTSLLNDEDNY